MDNRDYPRFEKEFRRVFDTYSSALALESVENVRHYLNVAELEMAYETFVLSLVEEQVQLSDTDRLTLSKLGPPLGVDADPVFKADFWDVAKRFLDRSG
jgi:hypothetical protein